MKSTLERELKSENLPVDSLDLYGTVLHCYSLRESGLTYHTALGTAMRNVVIHTIPHSRSLLLSISRCIPVHVNMTPSE